jgi:2-polyprenyl-3-methyl-5-hydroxy-6-metoxy-1,4-benzoquinol methylase
VNEMTQTKYILGHSQEEIRRLMLQATILRPFTERLLRNAEIGPGMRVLDLGCGAGDVSTTFAPGTTLPSADEAREAMPVASGRR